MEPKVTTDVKFRRMAHTISCPLAVRSAGIMTMQRQNNDKVIFSGEGAEFLICFYLLEGILHLRFQDKTFPVDTGNIIFIPPYTPFQQMTKSTAAKYMIFTFVGPMAPTLPKGFHFPVRTPWKLRCSLQPFYDKIRETFADPTPHGERIASLYAYEMLVFIAESGARFEQEQGNKNLVERAVMLIEEMYTEKEATVELIAAELNVSTSSLRRNFRKIMGISIKKYIDSLRIQYLLELIQTGNLSIKEITSRTGFSSPEYLNKFFHRHLKMSPSEFKQKLLTMPH